MFNVNKKLQFENGLKPQIQIAGKKGGNIIQRMVDLHIPSVSIALIEDGKTSWSQEYSVFDTKPNQPSIFQAGSISKTINAVLAMKVLVETGIIGLDDDINQHLKDWKIPKTTGEKVTLRQLLSHTAGTSVGGFLGYPSTHKIMPSTIDILNGNPKVDPNVWPPPEFPDGIVNNSPVEVIGIPGTAEAYSGGGTTIIQQLIEENLKLIGKETGNTYDSYADLAQKLIFIPLRMKSSTFNPKYPGLTSENIQIGHDQHGQPILGQWRIHPELAASGLWSNSEDLRKFAIAVLQSLNGENENFLKQHTAEEMVKRQPKSDFGLGFECYQFGEEFSFGHGGTNNGYECSYIIFPGKNAGAVIMTNSANGDKFIDECKRSLFETYHWADLPQTIKHVKELDVSQLKPCIGEYTFEFNGNKQTASVHIEGTKLFISIPYPRLDSVEKKRIELMPDSDHSFFSTETNMIATFNADYTQLVFWEFKADKMQQEENSPKVTETTAGLFSGHQRQQDDKEQPKPETTKSPKQE